MTVETNRRHFLRQSGALAIGTALAPNAVHSHGPEVIRFAVVGLGGRGTGAANQIMNARFPTRLVAVADAFPSRIQDGLTTLSKRHEAKVDVPPDRRFTGLDAYKKAIDCDVDLVVIATPPGFKPQQFEYAVNRGRHVFMEKPVATDAPGVRRVLVANELAKTKSLLVAIGLQRRHEERYIDCVKRIQDGAIGDVNLFRVYWNGSSIWHRARTPEQTEMMHQVHNWYHYIWTSGDQICEQHIHNIDVGCWIKGSFPVEANGMGGGEMRLGGDRTKSQIFDHTFVEFVFADGSRMYSQGRHLGGSFTHVGEYAHGSRGVSKVGEWIQEAGKARERMRGRAGGHQQEQLDLVDALSKGEIYNEGHYGAMSTFTAILGREACYSGKVISAKKLLAEGRDYAPGIDGFNLQSTPPVVPGKDGLYPAPVPGQHDPFAG